MYILLFGQQFLVFCPSYICWGKACSFFTDWIWVEFQDPRGYLDVFRQVVR